MHEAFNLGLDPSLDIHMETHIGNEKLDGELRRSENLWPCEKDWDGAEGFVCLAVAVLVQMVID